ncbi:uncharacterized protein LOC132041622 [Lycium ferocissimum]|uniref:uncharacterized protein LOC132041622 n=1 Tax=Lycium ferocissimum TaxID=112874 RepID=UPI00281668BE|nr:uncharacterized protein LOC132041622 [Lycium ferocissimum]XP_059288302.1 uncharacterized protein LOC132041622 [Lycium ferocissimum]
MGRGRGKGKKQSVPEDVGSGEEEKIPVRRRGRPQKPLKDEIEDREEVQKLVKDEDDGENISKDEAAENGKRKRSSQVKENVDSVKEENCIGTKASPNDLIKSVGFRQNGSRRKNKPRRAAEVGVECR